jgi:4-amino-4-deoxy-L-arabinose transferase-like glycosyltransferase
VAEHGAAVPRARAPWTDGLVLAAACLLVFGWGAADAPLFDLDEGAFSQATLEMLRSHDWLRTSLNGAPRYDKPILTYWLQAGSVLLLGVHELSFRLPSILAATAWALLVWRFACEYAGGRSAALFAAGSLATALMVTIIGHAAIADALLNLWLAGAMLDIYRHSRQPSRARVLRVFAWMALGTLTKGPIAVAVPVAVAFLFFALQRRLPELLRAALDPLGWIVYLGIVGVWVVPLLLEGSGDFLLQFLLRHNVGRLAEAAEGHGGGPWYYLIWLPVVVLPYTALLPRALGLARSWRSDPLATYLLLWFAVVFVVFSFSATQLPHYILYGCTPLFLLFGRERLHAPRAAIALAPALLFTALLTSLPLWLPLAMPPERRAYERGIVELAIASIGPSYYLLGAACIAGVIALLAWSSRPVWQRLLIAGALQAVLVLGAVMPVLADAQQVPTRDAGRIASQYPGEAVSYRTFLPSFSVYRGRATPNRSPQPGELVFLRKDRLRQLQREFPGEAFTQIYAGGGVLLLKRPEATASPVGARS